MTIICDRCECAIAVAPGSVTAPQPNAYGEFICDDCEQNAAEAAYERMCEDFHDGGSTAWPDSERKRMEEARKLK